jgi:hypothetical protein
MDCETLSQVIRRSAAALRSANETPLTDGELADDGELLLVLVRMLRGKSARQAFGAPGDWGYSTPIGSALAEIPFVKKAGDV